LGKISSHVYGKVGSVDVFFGAVIEEGQSLCGVGGWRVSTAVKRWCRCMEGEDQ
jgi:hypothetical protein